MAQLFYPTWLSRAIERCSLQLLRESKQRVPIDTGALRNSIQIASWCDLPMIHVHRYMVRGRWYWRIKKGARVLARTARVHGYPSTTAGCKLMESDIGDVIGAKK